MTKKNLSTEEILSLWEVDAKIDSTELADESLKIPTLHQKYLRLLTNERLILAALKAKFTQLKHEKYEFYTQGPTPEQIKNGINWKLPSKGMILKNEVDRYLEADKDLIDLALKIGISKEKIDLLTEIIKNINNRSFFIGNALDFLKFTNGQN